jgi:hypothetical protein
MGNEKDFRRLKNHESPPFALCRVLPGLGFQKTRRLNGGCRPHPCRGDNLPEMRVCRLPGCENTGFIGLHFIVNF